MIVGGYPEVRYRWQGISFHCWLTSLEMLMEWKYGQGHIFGQTGGALRAAHAATAVDHNSWHRPGRNHWGSAMSHHADDYGIAPADVAPTATIDDFRTALRRDGPMLAEGRFGPARSYIGGHVVVILGWSRTNKLAYYDPFLVGFHAWRDRLNYMTPAEAWERVWQFRNGGVAAGRGYGAGTRQFWQATWDDNPALWANLPMRLRA